MRPSKIVALVLAVMLLLCGCSAATEADTLSKPSSTAASSSDSSSKTSSAPVSSADSSAAVSAESPEEAEVMRILESMSLQEKIGQLFIVRPENLRSDLTPAQINDTKNYAANELTDDMKTQLERFRVGGVIMFSKNIASAEQIQTLIGSLQHESRLPLFVAVDEEGGTVARVANSGFFDVKKYNNIAEIGATGNPNNALELGRTLGGYLKPIGFNLDFAPDADVNTNPNNIVIGKRAFGSDPTLVSQMVCAELDGLHEAGVMGCIKHFPGHGDTTGDTHSGYVGVSKTWDELKQCELVPFIAALDKTDMVMAAHITAVNICADGLPASLSKTLITDKLRGELGYNGVVISDSMSMGAIYKQYTPAQAAVKAINAGVDIVLMPYDLEQTYDGVLKAVNSGEISEARIDESVRRILLLKQKYDLLNETPN